MKTLYLIIFVFCLSTLSAQPYNYSKDCKVIQENGKYGITFQEQLAIPCEFDVITTLNNSLYLVKKGAKNGLVCVHFYNNKHLRTKHTDRFFYPVKKGYVSIYQCLPCEYDIIERLESGQFQILQGPRQGIVNSYGNIIIPCKYEKIETLGQNFLVFSGDRQGIYNRFGNTVIPCKYTSIECRDRHYYVSDGPLKGVFNYYGNTIIPCKYSDINFKDKTYYVTAGAYQGVFNYYGNTIIPVRYTAIHREDKNYRVENGRQQGLFNSYGNTILPCQFESIREENNYFFVTKTGKQGVYNRYGTTIVPCRYDKVLAVQHKFIVKNGNYYGVINQYGTTVLPCRFGKIDILANGKYLTETEGSKQLYNAYGNLLSDYSHQNVIYSTEKAVE